jgi:hypothetical protein
MADEHANPSGELPTPPPANTRWSGLPDVDWYQADQRGAPQPGQGQWQQPPPYARGGSGYATPGAAYGRAPLVNKPKSNLVMAILVTLFCCLPFGIVAIVYAAQVDSKWNVGDWHGAQRASQSAKNWATASVVCGIVFSVLYVLFMMSLGTTTTTTGY